ncbi:MAG: hypothetical protein EWM47_07045 [Anaerolineaceae bacterium]|nr:MAG: hypothetical protein EWM47_07045 [Anaerolineaceae bacterium]
MSDIKDLLREAIASIERTTGLFYQQNTREGYTNLEQTLGSLSQLADLINTADSIDKDSLFISHFNDILKEALQALEQSDTILFSDILQYSLKELLESEL